MTIILAMYTPVFVPIIVSICTHPSVHVHHNGYIDLSGNALNNGF